MPKESGEYIKFKAELKTMIGTQILQSGLSGGLYKKLSQVFFEKSAEDRCTELVELSTDNEFYQLFFGSDITLYAFLLGAVEQNLDLMEKFKATPFKDLILSVELDNYCKQASLDWKEEIDSTLCSWMFHELPRNFYSLSPEERCNKLCALELGQAYFLSNLTSYNFLIKTVECKLPLIERLRASPLWSNLAPVELELFYKETRKLFAEEGCDKAFIANLSKYLNIDYFNTEPAQKLKILQNSSALIAYFIENLDSADKFLRKSLGESLIESLEDGALKNCLIPIPLRKFHEAIEGLNSNSFNLEFTKGLMENLPADFIKLSLEKRFEALRNLSEKPEALNPFRKNSAAANSFLRNSLKGWDGFKQLETHPILSCFLSAPRQERSRKLRFNPPAPEYKKEQEPPSKQARC